MAGELIRRPPQQLEVARKDSALVPAAPRELALYDDKGRQIARIAPAQDDISPEPIPPSQLPFSPPPVPPGGAVIQNIYMGSEKEQSETLNAIVADLSRPWVMGIWAVALAGLYFSGWWRHPDSFIWIAVALFGVLFGTAPHARKGLLGVGAIGLVGGLVWFATRPREVIAPPVAPVVQPATVVTPPAAVKPVKRKKAHP